mmetsp:Transcript_4991/g.16727  ORF Transcript_4991/g.16727 Transcript_4991/m.16727 type:complete len:321 (+) Transcript_4991:39-1001(+)
MVARTGPGRKRQRQAARSDADPDSDPSSSDDEEQDSDSDEEQEWEVDVEAPVDDATFEEEAQVAEQRDELAEPEEPTGHMRRSSVEMKHGFHWPFTFRLLRTVSHPSGSGERRVMLQLGKEQRGFVLLAYEARIGFLRPRHVEQENMGSSVVRALRNTLESCRHGDPATHPGTKLLIQVMSSLEQFARVSKINLPWKAFLNRCHEAVGAEHRKEAPEARLTQRDRLRFVPPPPGLVLVWMAVLAHPYGQPYEDREFGRILAPLVGYEDPQPVRGRGCKFKSVSTYLDLVQAFVKNHIRSTSWRTFPTSTRQSTPCRDGAR